MPSNQFNSKATYRLDFSPSGQAVYIPDCFIEFAECSIRVLNRL